jgi:hypothetical protein
MLPTKLLLEKSYKDQPLSKNYLNAVDAKASDIKLIIKDAGKRSVIDNGLGMSYRCAFVF